MCVYQFVFYINNLLEVSYVVWVDVLSIVYCFDKVGVIFGVQFFYCCYDFCFKVCWQCIVYQDWVVWDQW